MLTTAVFFLELDAWRLVRVCQLLLRNDFWMNSTPHLGSQRLCLVPVYPMGRAVNRLWTKQYHSFCNSEYQLAEAVEVLLCEVFWFRRSHSGRSNQRGWHWFHIAPCIELLFSDFFTSKTFLYFHNLLLLHFMSRLRVEKISLRRFASFGVEKEPGYVDYITPLCRYSLRCYADY